MDPPFPTSNQMTYLSLVSSIRSPLVWYGDYIFICRVLLRKAEDATKNFPLTEFFA